MLGEDATLQRVALHPAHARHVQGVGLCCLIRWLLQLAPVDQLHVGNGYSSGFAGILVVEPAAQRSEHLRPVVSERACCAR
jgi:hypothetical protein